MRPLPNFSKKLFHHLIVAMFLEFGPVLVFLVSFEYLSMHRSTLVLMMATIISTIVTYRIQKRLPYLALYVALITSIFGYMTIAHHQFKFIQIRDTLYDATCALTLMIGLMIRVPFLKLAFQQVIPMASRSWNKLTYLWIGYFIIAMIANEVVRRSFSVEGWFFYKSIMIPITVIFGLTSLYFSYEKETTTSHHA
jgi:intracellular septation protein